MSRRKERRVNSIREYLDRQRLSQADLAAALGISVSTVSRYISGERQPRLSLAVRIHKLTGIPVERLLASEAA